ncbi:MAG: SDR family oxidoreductase [Phycisphaerae bacterium]|jgi:UDP-glucose 4-epimerase
MNLYLVTGGAGFIGSHVVRRLLARGDRVRILDDMSTGRPANLADIRADVDFVEGDIRDLPTVQRAATGTAAVFHLAARASVPRSVAEPLPANDVNITGTLNVLLAARDAGAERVIYSASSSAYGDTPTLPKIETMTPQPLSPYAVGKLAAENYCTCFHTCYGLQTISLRYFNVFGPRQDPNSQYAAVIPAFVTHMVSGRRPVIFGDGEQSRDFCYIDNVVNANLLALEAAELGGAVVNIACGERTTLNEIVRLINGQLGTDLAAEHQDPRVGDVRHSLADVAAAKRVIGYEPKIFFQEGLARSIEWYRQNPS